MKNIMTQYDYQVIIECIKYGAGATSQDLIGKFNGVIEDANKWNRHVASQNSTCEAPPTENAGDK